MRRILHRINISQSTRSTNTPTDFLNIIDGTEQIAGVVDRREPSAVGDELVELLNVELIVRAVEIETLEHQATLFGQDPPRRCIGIVLHASDDNLVSLIEQVRDCASHHKSKRSCIGAKHDFARRVGVIEVGHCFVSRIDQRRRLASSREVATHVRVAMDQSMQHSIDDLLGHLSTRRIVKINTAATMIIHSESWKQ